MTEDGGRMTEDRGQKAEYRGRMTENRGWGTETSTFNNQKTNLKQIQSQRWHGEYKTVFEGFMAKLRPLNLMFLLMLLLFGCSGIRVSQDYPATADYAFIKTYAWQSAQQEKTGDLRLDNPLRDVRIRNAVDKCMASKGYRLASDASPDVFIAYHQEIYSRIDVENAGSGFVFGTGTFGTGGGIAFGAGNRASDYDETMLVIDIIDAASKELVWRGTATCTFVQHTDPEKLTERINETVQKLLSQFPPQKK